MVSLSGTQCSAQGAARNFTILDRSSGGRYVGDLLLSITFLDDLIVGLIPGMTNVFNLRIELNQRERPFSGIGADTLQEEHVGRWYPPNEFENGARNIPALLNS